MTKLHELAQLGQSIWLDYIRRSFISSGELQQLIDQGLRGMTSNPSIFEKAISGSTDYAADLERLVREGKSLEEIYEALVVDDIRAAADLLRPVYDSTNGDDGYVSLEVSPTLARDTEGTLAEAQRLWSLVSRPNLMIKIPATKEGLPAITRALMSGINVNVTLIFSLERYAEVIEAYLSGLEERANVDLPIQGLASVASFFVSRVDSKVDPRLEEIIAAGGPLAGTARSLLGKAAVANAKLAYQQFCAIFEGPRFARLREQGARYQRPLWASTSTKNPAYSDIKYVEELIGPHTVNTLPQETIDAFVDHGLPRLSLEEEVEGARAALEALEELGISMEQVTRELEVEGVEAFAHSFEKLMTGLTEKQRSLGAAGSKAQPKGEPSQPNQSYAVEISAGMQAGVNHSLTEMAAQNIIKRIWDLDYTIWKPQPTEITNRLGWLHSPEDMRLQVGKIESLVKAVRSDAYTHALLLGMGGSSLAPELFSRTFTGKLRSSGGLQVEVLDSTHPEVVQDFAKNLDPFKTLFIVSTKSGTTEETLSFFKYFYNQVAAAVGKEQAGDHFVAITDPGSKLAQMGEQYRFREVFLNDPNIGGRYSALSFFGLVPAALAGVDLGRLLDSAAAMAERCKPNRPVQDNPAARLGALLGEAARSGRDKLTFSLSPAIASFGDWVEQLIAESTGKEGKGILPVVGEPLGPPAGYGGDRLFVQIRLEDDASQDAALAVLQQAGFPVVRLLLQDAYDLGGQFFLWELATAVASHLLGINPFDQPNVESAKIAARGMMAAYKATGALPETRPDLQESELRVYYPPQGLPGEAHTPVEALRLFLEGLRPGDYIALQAFLRPTPEVTSALDDLRLRLRGRYPVAATLGFGPRFLHSTGQLHKGDAGRGLFLQFTGDPAQDAPIPDEAGLQASSSSFGALLLAQALGDRQALLDAGRRVLRFHLGSDPAAGIRLLGEGIE
jgi:transaldolase/glucose-6-phosphate isomerase